MTYARCKGQLRACLLVLWWLAVAPVNAAENGLLFVETSAKTAVGVEELFRDIARKLPRAAPASAAVAQPQGQQGAGFSLSGGRLGDAAQQPCSSCAV